MHAYVHAYIRTYIYMHTYTYKYTYIYTHIHAYTRMIEIENLKVSKDLTDLQQQEQVLIFYVY